MHNNVTMVFVTTRKKWHGKKNQFQDPLGLSGPTGTLETPSNPRDSAEPLGTLRISLESPSEYRYSSGCDVWKAFLRNNIKVFYIQETTIFQL